jgi:hypothetical protein
MTQRRPPRLAVALLHRFSADPALIGDVLEEYEQRRSRPWLWRQVTAAVAVNLSGRAREAQPHRWKPVSLTAAPRGSAVGGLGLVALAVLISLVLPQAWWLLAIGAAGGIGLGAARVIINHRRELRRATHGRRNILLPVVLLMAACHVGSAHSSQQPVAPVRLDPIEGIADAFKSHHVVMLPGGHGSKPFHDLLLSLARDSRIQAVVNDIVVEFGSSRYQDLIDRFMRGDEISDAALRQVWQNTTIPGVTHDGPYVEEFYRTLREINASLPKERQYRVLLGDPPIDWDHITNKGDLRKWTVLRDSYPADLIRREVTVRGRRALVVYGHLHFPRKEMLSNYDMSNWQAQTMTSLLESVPGTKVFAIWAEGGDEIVKLQPGIASWPRLSLTRIRGTVLGAADFTLFNGAAKDRYTIRGVDDFVKIPKDRHLPMRMEDQVDAIIWNGNAPPKPILLSAATCADSAYLPMRLARIALSGIPPGEADAVKRACAVHKF